MNQDQYVARVEVFSPGICCDICRHIYCALSGVDNYWQNGPATIEFVAERLGPNDSTMIDGAHYRLNHSFRTSEDARREALTKGWICILLYGQPRDICPKCKEAPAVQLDPRHIPGITATPRKPLSRVAAFIPSYCTRQDTLRFSDHYMIDVWAQGVMLLKQSLGLFPLVNYPLSTAHFKPRPAEPANSEDITVRAVYIGPPSTFRVETTLAISILVNDQWYQFRFEPEQEYGDVLATIGQ